MIRISWADAVELKSTAANPMAHNRTTRMMFMIPPFWYHALRCGA
jgi:hypothetical protein